MDDMDFRLLLCPSLSLGTDILEAADSSLLPAFRFDDPKEWDSEGQSICGAEKTISFVKEKREAVGEEMNSDYYYERLEVAIGAMNGHHSIVERENAVMTRYPPVLTSHSLSVSVSVSLPIRTPWRERVSSRSIHFF